MTRDEQLDTEVKRFELAKFKNPIHEDRVGRYRSFDSKMCATAEMEIIREYCDNGQEPPSFFEAGPREYLYFNPKDVRIGIVTPGGIAPGLNTVIHSIISMHKIYGMEQDGYGFMGGFRGLAEDRKDDLTPDKTRDWIHKGGTMLVAGREKQDVYKMVNRLEDNGVHILYVVGGDGSLTAAHQIAQEIERRDAKIVVAGIPKTMDNDILWTWESFGFNTAVEEATKAINAIHDETMSTERVCLLSLFGRDAGFVAAHAALASGQADVVLVPEVPFKMELLIEYVKNVVRDKNYALVVLAEGACPEEYSEDDAKKELIKQGLNPDDKTNPKVREYLAEWRLYFLKTKFDEEFEGFKDGRHRVFINEPRYLVRSVPPNSFDQRYCQRLADLAVHNALAGFTDFMISQWLTEYVLVPLRLIAEQKDSTGKRITKKIPPSGIFWKTVISSTRQPSFIE